MPTRRFQPLKAKDTRTDQAYSEISQVIDALAPLEAFPLRTEARLDLAAGTFTRIAARSGGTQVSIPTADATNFGQTITLLIEASLGRVRVRPTTGTISGSTSLTIPAGVRAEVRLVSGGGGMWLDPSFRFGNDVRIQAQGDVEVTADESFTVSAADITTATLGNTTIQSTGAGSRVTINGQDDVLIQADDDDVFIDAGDNVQVTASQLLFNGDDVLTDASGAAALRGEGLTVDGTKLKQRLRPRLLQIQDWFIDQNTTGTIGQLGWRLVAGTISRSVNVNFTQTVRFTLVSPSASNGGLALGSGTNGIVSNANVGYIQAGIAIPSAPPANWHVGFGISDDQDAPFASVADGVGIYATNASANWQAIVRSGSAGSPTDTGIAASTSLQLVTVRRVGANYEFYVGNTLAATIAGSFSGNAAPCFVCGTTTAASTVTFPIGHFTLNSEPGGYLDDDAFLEV